MRSLALGLRAHHRRQDADPLPDLQPVPLGGALPAVPILLHQVSSTLPLPATYALNLRGINMDFFTFKRPLDLPAPLVQELHS